MSERARRYLGYAIGVALAVAGVCYSSWLLEFVVDTGLNPLHSFLSELESPDRPYRALFRYGDVITGTLCVVAGIAGLIGYPRRLFSTVGWAAIFAFGASTFADSQTPVGCMPTPVHTCANEPSGLLPQLHHVHALTSTLAVTSMFVAMIAWTLAARRYQRWRLLRTVGLGLLLVTAAATIWLAIADNVAADAALGVAQRVQVGCMSLWLITVAVAIAIEGDSAAPENRTAKDVERQGTAPTNR